MKINVSKDIISQLREELSHVKRANSQLQEELNRFKTSFKAIQTNFERSLEIIQKTQQQSLPEVERASTVNDEIFERDFPVAVTTANTPLPVTSSNLSRSTSPIQPERLSDESVQQHANSNNGQSIVLQSEVITVVCPSAQEQNLKVNVAKKRPSPPLKLPGIAKETKLRSQVSVNLYNINEDGVINDDCHDKEDSDRVLGKDEDDFRATDINLKKKSIRANGFTKKAHTMKHIRVHNGQRYVCDVKNCNSVFTSFNGLKYHKLIHAGLKPFRCNECNRSFSQKSHLSVHMLTHTGEKPFSCNECNTSFRHKSNLAKHMFIHSGEKPHLCDVCHTSFNTKSNLSRHMLIHTGEKPFFCKVCETSFREKRHLSNHLNIHTGEKPHSCKVCNMSFRQRHHLTRHSRIHTGEKPFVCTVCNASFRHKLSLSLHSKKCVGGNQVKEQLLFCDFCGKGFSNKTNLRSHCLNCFKNRVGTRSSN